MIYTLTLNPALDYRMELSSFKHHQLNRADFTKYRAGGKGINVSEILSILGTKNVALGFVGGFTGNYFEQYIKTHYDINTDFITIEDLTRINVKLKHEGQTTEVNASGPKVTESEAARLFDQFARLTPEDIVVLAGSSVSGNQFTYEDIVKFLSERGIEFVMDIDSEDFMTLLEYKPLLVKPNVHEVEKLLKRPMNSEKEIIDAAQYFIKKGAKHVIISRGAMGSIYADKDHVYVADSIKGEVRNTVGAGDSMVGGFLSAYANQQAAHHCFKQSVACGSATAFEYGLAKRATIDSILKKVIINEVKA